MTVIDEEEDTYDSPGPGPGPASKQNSHNSAQKVKKRAIVLYDMKQEEEKQRVATEGMKANQSKNEPDGLQKKGAFDLQDEYIKFRDFAEPNIIKTGYLIPLKCGHNGNLLLNERTIYEIHLMNAGFINPN